MTEAGAAPERYLRLYGQEVIDYGLATEPPWNGQYFAVVDTEAKSRAMQIIDRQMADMPGVLDREYDRLVWILQGRPCSACGEPGSHEVDGRRQSCPLAEARYDATRAYDGPAPHRGRIYEQFAAALDEARTPAECREAVRVAHVQTYGPWS